jgi:hypothetical protein
VKIENVITSANGFQTSLQQSTIDICETETLPMRETWGAQSPSIDERSAAKKCQARRQVCGSKAKQFSNAKIFIHSQLIERHAARTAVFDRKSRKITD